MNDFFAALLEVCFVFLVILLGVPLLLCAL